MISIKLDGVKKVLCLGAHSDDIEIGCGGTVLKLMESSKDIEFFWMVMTSNAERESEARQSARAFLRKAAKKTVIVKSFRDGFLPYIGTPVKECFEELKRSFSPDVIFTPYRHDLHQDHRFVCELTWNTFRNHLILEYEIPKYDADLGFPNFFVALSESIRRRKVERLMRHFGSQRDKRWFSEGVFNGLMRLRGMECASTTSYAEAFHCRKIVVDRPI